MRILQASAAGSIAWAVETRPSLSSVSAAEFPMSLQGQHRPSMGALVL